MNLNERARDLLEGYLFRLRGSLAARGGADIDAHEIEADVRDHVREALRENGETVGVARMQSVLDAMGNPVDWASASAPLERVAVVAPATSTSASAKRDDWTLAYVSLGLLLLAFALPPFLWVGVFGAFLVARASLCAPREHDCARTRAAQAWVRNPALLAIYVPGMMLLLLWPAIALRFAADFVVDNPGLFAQVPIEVEWIAERIARIRLSNFDPATALENAVRTGHFLLFPVACWLLLLAAIVAIAPRSFAALFRPFFGRGSRGIAGSLAFCGFLLLAASLGLALLKQTLVPASLI